MDMPRMLFAVLQCRGHTPGRAGISRVRCAAQLDIERKLRALLTKEKEKAEEEAALAMGLCTGGSMLS